VIGEVLHSIEGAVDDPTEQVGVHLLPHLPQGQVVEAGSGRHLHPQFHRVLLHPQQDQLYEMDNTQQHWTDIMSSDIWCASGNNIFKDTTQMKYLIYYFKIYFVQYMFWYILDLVPVVMYSN